MTASSTNTKFSERMVRSSSGWGGKVRVALWHYRLLAEGRKRVQKDKEVGLLEGFHNGIDDRKKRMEQEVMRP